MRVLFSLALLSATACIAYPQHKAQRTDAFTVPADGLHGLKCQSQNGAIRVAGDSRLDRIEVKVEISVRGQTQAEADASLGRLEVVKETRDGLLHLSCKRPDDLPDDSSPGFAFTVRVPERCLLELSTHNGSVEVQGTRGDLTLATHNGGVRADVTSGKLQIATHNGTVEVTARGGEAISGTIETHNGAVGLAVPDGASTKVKVRTHNGSIEVGGAARALVKNKRSAEAVYGDGRGELAVTTSNGSVRLQ
jgi:hypothetical protein